MGHPVRSARPAWVRSDESYPSASSTSHPVIHPCHYLVCTKAYYSEIWITSTVTCAGQLLRFREGVTAVRLAKILNEDTIERQQSEGLVPRFDAIFTYAHMQWL